MIPLMHGIQVSRTPVLPDPERLALYRRAPELGPRPLFFSGGTALRKFSQKLIEYTHNSIHILTPFDSGGSSAVIRKAFGMLAVGDIRNRIMALADRGLRGNSEIFNLFAHRLPKDAEPEELRRMLDRMAVGKNDMLQGVPNPMRRIIRGYLWFFHQNCPYDFDLRGACLGNLILTGGFLFHDRHIDPVVYLFTKLVEARGDVCAVSNKHLQLIAELEDGTVLPGQHLITGKETAPIASPVARVYLSESAEYPAPVEVSIRDKIRNRIMDAQLICYPIGSFYSSVIANLLPKGVGDAIAAVARPKIYIPNLGKDPEQLGITVTGCVRTLQHYLQLSCERPAKSADLLNLVLVDSRNGDYQGGIEHHKLRSLGVDVIDVELITEKSHPYLDEERLIENLLSLA